MNAREIKARQIMDGGRIYFAHGYYVVPSQSRGARHKVTVDGFFPTCTCEDFELTNQPCKHILAVQLFIEAQKQGLPPQPPSTEPPPKLPRKTYPQDWPNYNLAQTRERDHFMQLLADLCATIPEPPRPKRRGRPCIPLADAVYAACFKVYSTLSARRFTGDLNEAKQRGYVRHQPHYNSIFNYLEDEALTPILHGLITKSAVPLKEVETQFAVDSSGFCTNKFIRWLDLKYGATRVEAVWVKVHAICGTKTNVVTAVTIKERHAHDAPQFPGLVKATAAAGFNVQEVSADAAYPSTDNFQAAEDVGGTAYIPFKSNATGETGGIYQKAFHYFCLNREEFLQHYHRRSNVESTFSMIKRKFGDSVRSKTDVAMVNETLCKVVCHNVCCLIAEMYTLGIVPAFFRDDGDGPRDVLPMVRPR